MQSRPNRHVREQGDAFVRDVSAVQRVACGLTYRSFAARLRCIERVHVRQLRRHPLFQREIRRRIAELLLLEATVRGCPFETCRRRMKELEKLGFTDIESKAFYSLIYARAARRHGHRRLARGTAIAMTDELRRSLRRRKSRLAQSYVDSLEEFLAQTR